MMRTRFSTRFVCIVMWMQLVNYEVIIEALGRAIQLSLTSGQHKHDRELCSPNFDQYWNVLLVYSESKSDVRIIDDVFPHNYSWKWNVLRFLWLSQWAIYFWLSPKLLLQLAANTMSRFLLEFCLFQSSAHRMDYNVIILSHRLNARWGRR